MPTFAQTRAAASPHRNVSITRLADAQAVFPDIVKETISPLLPSNTIAIRNNDQRRIVGMVGVWKVTDSTGQTKTSTFASDIYLSLRENTVLPSGKSILLTPAGWINPDVYRKLREMGRDSESLWRAQPLSEQLTGAREVTVSIDSVIFDDGELCGANTKRLDERIYARKRAALFISSLVEASLARGEQWRSALEPYRVSESSKPYDEAFWKERFAAELLEQDDPRGVPEFLEKLPSPPVFHACREQK